APPLQDVVLHQMRRVGGGHGLVVAPAVHGDIAGATVFLEAITDHPVFIPVVPPRTAHVVVAATFPTDAEGAVGVQAQGRRATVLPVGKEKISHMAGGMVLAYLRRLGVPLGIGLELVDATYSRLLGC